MPKLCLGGTFNPIHHAHLLCARAAAEAVGASGVTLIPTGNAPHKRGDLEIAPSEDRLKMCELAIKDATFFEISDNEIRRGGVSYTIDTVRQMKEAGAAEVHWLIGADMLNTLPTWREATALLAEVSWVIMARPGEKMDWTKLGKGFETLRSKVVEVPQIEISSTEIRRRVKAGLPIDYLTPPAVCRYISENGLYR